MALPLEDQVGRISLEPLLRRYSTGKVGVSQETTRGPGEHHMAQLLGPQGIRNSPKKGNNP